MPAVASTRQMANPTDNQRLKPFSGRGEPVAPVKNDLILAFSCNAFRSYKFELEHKRSTLLL